jgi:hypothetical protein
MWKAVTAYLAAVALVFAPLVVTAQIVGGQQPTVLQPLPPPAAFATGVAPAGGAMTVAALSGCSAGGTPSLSGTQEAFRLTAGTTTSATCTITWPFPRTNVPVCVIMSETAATNAGLAVGTNSTTTLTWSWTTTVVSSVWDVVCKGV